MFILVVYTKGKAKLQRGTLACDVAYTMGKADLLVHGRTLAYDVL